MHLQLAHWKLFHLNIGVNTLYTAECASRMWNTRIDISNYCSSLLMDFGNILYKALQFERGIHRLFQKKRSIFWEVTVSVIVRKKAHVNICLILNGYWDREVWIYRPNSLRSSFVGLDVYRGKVNTERFLARILDAGAIKKHEDQFKQYATFALELQSTFRLTVGFLNILLSVTYLSFLCNTFVI
jgi:hypothetical protein